MYSLTTKPYSAHLTSTYASGAQIIPASMCLAAEGTSQPVSRYAVVNKHGRRDGMNTTHLGIYSLPDRKPITQLISFSQSFGPRSPGKSCFDYNQKPMQGLSAMGFPVNKIRSSRSTEFSDRVHGANSAIAAYYRMHPYSSHELPSLTSQRKVPIVVIENVSIVQTPIDERIDSAEFLKRYRNPAESMDGVAFSTMCLTAGRPMPCFIVRGHTSIRTQFLPFPETDRDLRGAQWVFNEKNGGYLVVSGLLISRLQDENHIELWRYGNDLHLSNQYRIPADGFSSKGNSMKQLESASLDGNILTMRFIQHGKEGEIREIVGDVQIHDRITITAAIP